MKNEAKRRIFAAFAQTEYPGDWCLRGSREGAEPLLVEQEFCGKRDWRVLKPEFLDQAPAGYGTALCFFSDEAFRFYLPAYLLADLDRQLSSVDVVFHLCHGLDDKARSQKVNPWRYGDRTWFDEASHRFAVFNREQAAAIVKYLEFKLGRKGLSRSEKRGIQEAITNYWAKKAGRLGDRVGEGTS
jgi:hypothetical protein